MIACAEPEQRWREPVTLHTGIIICHIRQISRSRQDAVQADVELTRLALLVAAEGAAISPAAPVADKPIAPGGPDLKTMLEKGLRARRPAEFAFIHRVVKLVNQGKLPISVVETSFLWARPKRPYPMPYFMQTMEVRARKVAVHLWFR